MQRQVITPDEVEALRARCAELLTFEGVDAGREVHQEAGAPRLSALNAKGPEFDACGFNTTLLSAASCEPFLGLLLGPFLGLVFSLLLVQPSPPPARPPARL